MSEWSNVPVLKTGEGNTSGSSNLPLPAIPQLSILNQYSNFISINQNVFMGCDIIYFNKY